MDTTTTNTSEPPIPTGPVESEHVQGQRGLIWALAICLISVMIFRSFFFEAFRIPSSSMVPTLRVGDQIFVSKFNFGLFLPLTKFEFLKFGSPKRGDVVVFLFPRDESLHYIKRVVGLPGDRVEFKGMDLIINGNLVPKEKVTDPGEVARVMGDIPGTEGEIYRENLDGVSHYVRFTRRPDADFQRSAPVEKVPEGYYFMAGDNRDDSYDSRFWGPVARANLRGKAQLIWLSFNQDRAWSSLSKIRWARCGSLIR